MEAYLISSYFHRDQTFIDIRVLIFLLLSCVNAYGQERVTGPVIPNFGHVFAVDDPDFKIAADQKLYAVFDISTTPDDPAQVNPLINSLARFLNMHAQAGIPLENLKVAFAIHGVANKDVLNNEAYQKRFQMDNPNLELIRELEVAGAEMYICGQTMAFRKVARSELTSEVKVALSAMTVLVSLQAQGYGLISF